MNWKNRTSDMGRTVVLLRRVGVCKDDGWLEGEAYSDDGHYLETTPLSATGVNVQHENQAATNGSERCTTYEPWLIPPAQLRDAYQRGVGLEKDSCVSCAKEEVDLLMGRIVGSSRMPLAKGETPLTA